MKPPVIRLLLAFLGIWPGVALGDDLVGREMDIQEIVASLEANDLSANEIRAIDTYVRLDVIDLNAFQSSDEYEALATALSSTDDGWAMVQTAIVANDLLKQELTRRSVPIRRVVAATMDDTDVMAIYIR